MNETKGVELTDVDAPASLSHTDAVKGSEDMTTPASKRSTGTPSPAFQFYPKDFLTSPHVVDMSMTERGMYITLLSHCWLEGSLPHDPQKLARMCHMTLKSFVRIWTKGPLQNSFTEQGDRLINTRMEIERKKQSDYRELQKDRANTRRSDKLAYAEPMQALHASGHALLSSSSDPSLHTPVRAEMRTPILDNSHRKHAHCGRVCLPASLFSEFVRRRNHDGADQEIRDWALSVEGVWVALKDEPGDSFDFWKARYSEKWPTAKAAAVDKWEASLPEWARKARANKAAQS